MMPTLLLIIARPFRAAERLKQEPRWLVAFLLIAAGMVVLRLAWHPQLVQSVVAALPPSATPGDQAWARAVLDEDLFLRCLFLPLRQLAGMAVFAYALFLLCSSLNPPARAHYRQLLALEVHAELFNLFGGWLSWALLLWIGDGNWPENHLISLLTTKEIFTLWYLIAMTIGITVLFGFSRLKAGLLATTAWIVSVLFNTFLLQSVTTSLHLRV